MSSQKIADFFAEIGIKVSDRSLKALEKNLEKIVKKLEAAESRGRAMSGILRGTSKAADAENKSLQAGNKILAERQKRYEGLNRVTAKAQEINRKALALSRRQSAFAGGGYDGYYRKHFMAVKAKADNAGIWRKNFREALGNLTPKAQGNLKSRQAMYENLFGITQASGANSAAWRNNFRNSLAGMTAAGDGSRIKNERARQMMYNNLFGAVDTKAQERIAAEIEKAHGKALEMDRRRTAEMERRTKAEALAEKRLQALAAKTAAIREAGAAKAAAMLRAAEMRQQQVARAVGRPRASGFNGAAVGGAFGALSSHIAGFLPGFGAAYALANANRIGQEIQGQKMALTAVTGNEGAGAAAMGRLRNMGNEIGFDWRAVSGSFTKMLASGKGAGMDQATTEQIFRSMTEYGRVMGLDGEAMKGSLRAVEQMMNKGQVMAEELKNQLGERFPAAVSLMAKAMSKKEGKEVTTAQLLKMMENGQVKSDVLVQFAQVLSEEARVGGALEKAMRSTAAEQARFNNSVSGMIETMWESGLDEGFGRVFGTMSKFIDENEAGFKRLGQGLNTLSYIFQAFVNGLKIGLSTFSDLANYAGMSDTALAGLLFTALSMLNPFTRFVSIAVGLGAALEDLYVYSQGGISVFGEWKKSLDGPTLAAVDKFEQRLSKFANSAQTMLSNIGTLFSNLATALGEGGIVNAAFRGILDIFGSMIDRLSTLFDLLGKLAAGDFAGAGGIVGSTIVSNGAAIGGKLIQGADAILPGNPFGAIRDAGGGAIDYILDNTPEKQRQRRMQEMIDRQKAWEESRSGKTGDIPKVENSGNTINITIPGSNDPDSTAKAVREELSTLFQITNTSFPEEYA